MTTRKPTPQKARTAPLVLAEEIAATEADLLKAIAGEQKTAIRELFAGVDPLVVGNVLKAAFNNQPVNGRFSISQAEAIALLEVGNHDRDLFLVEAASLPKAA
jgi:hypothetical protein